MKLKNRLNRIPRPLKACVCAVLVILLAITYYIALGCPTITFRQEFRRAEKAHLVGPSTIVDTMNGEYSEFDKMIVGETEEGICFFGRYYNSFPYNDPFDEKQYYFSYVKKTGDLTLAAAPNVWGDSWYFLGFVRYVPVYLFTNEPEGIRAETDITVTGTCRDDSGEDLPFTQTFHSEADRSDEGFFRFALSADDEAGSAALNFLSCVTGRNVIRLNYGYGLTSITATVRLYDTDGTQIQEKELTLYSGAKS